jgi:glycosyltransferase involved in cell wall biosynthesis
MRVLYLTNNPNLGSTARILQSWLRLGRADGLYPAVVVPKAGDFSRWLADEGVPHLIDAMPWPNRRWPVPAVWHAARVARWAKRRQVRVIHCNEHDVYPFAVLLRRFLRLPMVCHVRFKLEESFGRWAFAKRTPDALLWTSRQQRDDYAGSVAGLVPEDRQHLIPLGLDLSTFGRLAAGRDATRRAWGVRENEIVIGTASALRPIKRIEDFIELVARLAAEDERVVGVLAGDAVPGGEAYREKVLERIRETGLGRRFVWVGHLEPIEPFFHAIDLFVSTSEYETFGNSVCEAMACGKPVAAYQGGSVAEVLGDAELVVPNGDLDGLTAIVRECLRDSGRGADRGRRGRARVAECFNPANSLRAVRQLYDELTGTAAGVRA